MTEPIGEDLLGELRRANPADPERMPSASLARVRARVQEATIMENERTATRRTRLRLVVGGLVAAVAALAVIAAVGPLSGGPDASPAPSGGGALIGNCVETYSLDTLKNRDFAFDGTLANVDGNEVTFDVNEAFRGVEGGQVTLAAEGLTGTTINSAGGPMLSVGERYLVAGDDRFVWACGFTQAYNPQVAADWATALGG